MLAPLDPGEALVDFFVLDPLLFVLPWLQVELIFLFLEVDADSFFLLMK